MGGNLSKSLNTIERVRNAATALATVTYTIGGLRHDLSGTLANVSNRCINNFDVLIHRADHTAYLLTNAVLAVMTAFAHGLLLYLSHFSSILRGVAWVMLASLCRHMTLTYFRQAHLRTLSAHQQAAPTDTEPTIIGIRTFKTNKNSTAPNIIAYEWGLKTANKHDMCGGRTWSSQYSHSYFRTVLYIGVVVHGACRIVGGRMRVSNSSSTAPFSTKRCWGKQDGEERTGWDGYCWSKQYGSGFQVTTFFVESGDQAKDAPNIVGGRMQVTNTDSTKRWVTKKVWGKKSAHEVVISDSYNWSNEYGEGYQYTSLYFEHAVQNLHI